MKSRKNPVWTGYAVWFGEDVLLDTSSYTTAVWIEGKKISVARRPAMAIYRELSAAKERAAEMHRMEEPAYVSKVRIEIVGGKA